MQQKYAKFEFREFGRNSVVYTPQKDETEAAQERIIDEALTTHFMSNSESPDNTLLMDNKPEPQINVEEIREESYKHGYNDAKTHYEPIVNQIKEDDSLANLLKEKLEAISQESSSQQDKIFRLSTSMVLALAKKMHLVMPTDFESIILGEMLSILNKYYKTGSITLKINPEKKDYCQNLLKISTLPERIMQNIIIETDAEMGKNNCRLDWHDTHLQYDQEQIILDAEKILEHLKMEINN